MMISNVDDLLPHNTNVHGKGSSTCESTIIIILLYIIIII